MDILMKDQIVNKKVRAELATKRCHFKISEGYSLRNEDFNWLLMSYLDETRKISNQKDLTKNVNRSILKYWGREIKRSCFLSNTR